MDLFFGWNVVDVLLNGLATKITNALTLINSSRRFKRSWEKIDSSSTLFDINKTLLILITMETLFLLCSLRKMAWITKYDNDSIDENRTLLLVTSQNITPFFPSSTLRSLIIMNLLKYRLLISLFCTLSCLIHSIMCLYPKIFNAHKKEWKTHVILILLCYTFHLFLHKRSLACLHDYLCVVPACQKEMKMKYLI